MKLFFKQLIVTIFISCGINTTSQAQPANVVKAGKAVFTLTTFKADGSILATTNGFFIGNNGEAVSAWKPFVGASSAVVIDADGNKRDVDVMVGANELYDICQFRVKGATTSASLSPTRLQEGGKAWLVDYSVKKPKCKEYTISKVETFMEKYNYYIFKDKVVENLEGCPFVNANGQVMGIMQVSKAGTEVHSTDAALAKTFTINGLTINDAVLRQTNIRVALPEKEEDAQLTLLMAGNKGDSLAYAQYIDDFIQQFPTSAEGYFSKAKLHVNANDFAAADAIMQTAIEKSTKKDEAHSDYATLIYLKEIYKQNIPYENWNLQKALDETNQAYSINPLTAYEHQKAQIIYAMGNYAEAHDIFMKLADTDLRNGELFYEAAQCKQQLKAPQEEILQLLDSAIAVSESTGRNNAAPYYFARGQAYDNAGEYRKAVLDYNQYDTLMYGRASHEFYYIKFKSESKIRQYQQALNDIAHAIVINRREPLYYAEMASLQLRVKQYENAIATCDICLQLDPEYADPYVIKGIAQAELNQKDKAKECFLKAKELGDERADDLLNKYQ